MENEFSKENMKKWLTNTSKTIILLTVAALMCCKIKYLRGSVGTGRRARLRILCLLQACGFKSRLPHRTNKRSRAKALDLLFIYVEGDLNPAGSSLLAINGSSVGSTEKRSTGPFFISVSPRLPQQRPTEQALSACENQVRSSST